VPTALTVVFCLLCALLPAVATADTDKQARSAAAFRDDVIGYARAAAQHTLLGAAQPDAQTLQQRWDTQYRQTRWSVTATLYHRGASIGEGAASAPRLAQSIEQAIARALPAIELSGFGGGDLPSMRIKLAFAYPPDRTFAVIEQNGRGLELLGDRIALRQLDTTLVDAQIAAGQRYLLGAMHPELHGFAKKYDAARDRRSTVLRTVYSASGLYTLLQVERYRHDPELEPHFRPIAAFLLSMQKSEGENAGAFYYAYDAATQEKTCRLVVGTAAKSIFALLELHRVYADATYLTAAQRAGNWLIEMIEPDGHVASEANCTLGEWHYRRRHSLLYAGQVLSALSRLAAATGEQRYRDGADRIAHYMTAAVAEQGAWLGDEFRAANSISTSWVTMALIDYAKINRAPIYRELIQQTAAAILARQIRAGDDAYNHGRYLDTMTSSGNGWVNEVMGELYRFCRAENLSDCGAYREAMILSGRWLLQSAYTPASRYALSNPGRAEGGFARSFVQRSVRTDAVCHGVNSLIALMRSVEPEQKILLTLPERSFEETLGLLRIGSGH
jgi:hypothetical protein